MPVYTLAATEHFQILWTPGADDGGLYVLAASSEDRWREPQFFAELTLIQSLADELRGGSETITVLSRVTRPFVPVVHRKPKKDGGSPDKAYYTPLVVEGEHRQELANALLFACSEENVTRLEADNSDESNTVLHGNYLESGLWNWMRSYPGVPRIHYGEPWACTTIQVPPAKLDVEPKSRLRAPSHNVQGSGTTLLRKARTKRRCSQRPCIDYAWIKPEAYYVEHQHGRHTTPCHIKCAFRSGKIPVNWLNPHFEQYYTLVEIGLQAWVEREREKREDYDGEKFDIPSYLKRVTEFVQEVEGGYELDKYERQEWRDHLRHVPLDVEPYQTARKLVDLPDPRSSG